MAQTTSLVFNGGVIPSPSPAPAGSGKAKLLKIGEITIVEQEVQVTKKVICDPDSVTTVAPFMEVLTSARLAELISANSILVLDDGTVQYLMADATVVVEDGTSVCTSVSFLGLSLNNRAKVLYPCARVTDELTLQQVLEVGEPVETNFDLVKAYSEDTEAGTLIDKLMVEDTVQGPDDQTLLEIVQSEDSEGHAKVAINEDNLRRNIDGIYNSIEGIVETIDEMDVDSVPHAYLHSTLNRSAGDSVATRTTIEVFAQDALEGDCFEFEQTTTIDDTPFGYIWIEPGTYLINAAVTLQWVGNPRGTFIAKVGSVMGESFDFSQEQELKRQSTKVVTIPNRMKLAINVTYDAGTPVMGFWIQSMQVVKLAGGMSQTNITHDDTLVGQGSISNPLGVDEAKVAQSTLAGIKNLPDKKEGYVALNDGNGTGKFDIETIFNNFAGKFVPNSTTTVAERLYMYEGSLYLAKEAYQGPWDVSKFESVNLSDFVISKILESYNESRYENVQGSDFIRPLNLIDKTKLSSLGEWCNYTNGEIESTQYVMTYKHTPYIKIRPSTYYSRWNKSNSRVAGVAFFDSDFDFISGSNSSSIVQSPATAAYIIMNINTAFESEDNALLLEGSKTLNWLHPIPYEKDLEASGKIGPKYFEGIDVDKNFITRSTKNLIDKTKLSALGEWCNYTNGEIESTQHVTNYRHTPFILVKPSTYYSRRNGTGTASVVFFGSSYEYLGYSKADKFQTPADCCYLILNTNYESIDYTLLFEGNVDINNNAYIFPTPPESFDFAQRNPNLITKEKLGFEIDDDFVVLGKNLINKEKLSALGEWCNYTNGKIESTQYVTNYRHTPPILVKPSTYYSVRQERGGTGSCFFDEYGNFISSSRDSIFQTPANCKYLIRSINTSDEPVDDALLVEGQETISKHGYEYPAPPYYYDFKYPKPVVPERDYVTVGASGADFTSVGDAFTYAIAHDKWVKILPGVYDLVAEGISGIGYLLPKKVEGYGAKLVCNLDEEDWNLSPLNTHSGYDTIEVYGLEVECDNCRYTIHDDPGNTKPYHHIFKDLILTHKSVVTEVILAPDNIGGGFGNGGNIEIINCKMNAAGPRNFAWHSRTTQQDYAGVVECHGCVLNKYAGMANGGSWTGLFNILYISDCLCGSLPSTPAEVNAKTVSWNNTTMA